MPKVVACIDGSPLSVAVCDAAVWASSRLSTALTLLHVLEREETDGPADWSGSIGLGSREHLLQELTELDAQKSRLAMRHGQILLEEAQAHAQAQGVATVETEQRHEALLDALQARMDTTRLFVLGRSGVGHESSAEVIGNHIESAARIMSVPLLITTPRFREPQSFLLAYDASETAERALAKVLASPLLQGLPCHLVMAGGEGRQHQPELQSAEARLQAAGFTVITSCLDGEVHKVLPAYESAHSIGLTVMGAYGHSRIKRLFIGSNTTRMIVASQVPLLLLR